MSLPKTDFSPPWKREGATFLKETTESNYVREK